MNEEAIVVRPGAGGFAGVNGVIGEPPFALAANRLNAFQFLWNLGHRHRLDADNVWGIKLVDCLHGFVGVAEFDETFSDFECAGHKNLLRLLVAIFYSREVKEGERTHEDWYDEC